jgi:hypothetical protein
MKKQTLKRVTIVVLSIVVGYLFLLKASWFLVHLLTKK